MNNGNNSLENDKLMNQMNIKSNFVTNEYDDDDWIKEELTNDRDAHLKLNTDNFESKSHSRSRQQQPRQANQLQSPGNAGKPKSIEEAARQYKMYDE